MTNLRVFLKDGFLHREDAPERMTYVREATSDEKSLWAEIERLREKLKPENREPPHCSTCACGLPAEPLLSRSVQRRMAHMKGEPQPEFGPSAEPIAVTPPCSHTTACIYYDGHTGECTTSEPSPKRDAMAESIAAQIEAGSPGPDWGRR